MGLVDGILTRFADKIGEQLQASIAQATPSQAYRDYYLKGDSYSVEADVSESLADLALMLSTMPITGDSQRAKWLDSLSDAFYRVQAKKLLVAGFISGDSLVVPSYNGRNIQNVIIGSDDFLVLDTSGEEMTACAYVLDRRYYHGAEYKLLQAVELIPYETQGGVAYANRYRMAVARNDSIINDGFKAFPDWENKYESEWYIPNVDRLLVARFKSFAIDTLNMNSVKGVPICFGASEHIREIHYILEQMHNEYGLSEKAIMADKRMFEKVWKGDELHTVMPKGRERLYVSVGGQGSDMPIKEWSPDIRYQAYIEALDTQMKLVEKSVGVSHGIISDSNDLNYQNTDNVRKSQQKTMSFISTTRNVAEDCLEDLVYSWNTLANYYNITPMGEYAVSYDWSDEYIESLTDRREAILAGNAIGATDALDYRMFVMHESPEAARERVEEIAEAKATVKEPEIVEV